MDGFGEVCWKSKANVPEYILTKGCTSSLLSFCEVISRKVSSVKRKVCLEYTVLRGGGTGFKCYSQNVGNIRGGKAHILSIVRK